MLAAEIVERPVHEMNDKSKLIIRTPESLLRLKISKLYLTRQFQQTITETSKLLVLKDHVISGMFISASFHIGNFDEAWNELLRIYEGYLPIHVVSAAALLFAQKKEYILAKNLIETWTMKVNDELCELYEKDLRAYVRLMEIYINAMAGLEEYQTASYFLELNPILSLNDKQMLNKKLELIKKVYLSFNYAEKIL
jgi:hypothetical protein